MDLSMAKRLMPYIADWDEGGDVRLLLDVACILATEVDRKEVSRVPVQYAEDYQEWDVKTSPGTTHQENASSKPEFGDFSENRPQEAGCASGD